MLQTLQPVTIHGAFIRDNDRAYRWCYDPHIQGEFCIKYLDGHISSELPPEDQQKAETAFRQGFLKGIQRLVTEFQDLPKHELDDYGYDEDANGALSYVARRMVSKMEEDAKEQRERYCHSIEIALPGNTYKRYACRHMYRVGHWFHSACLRGLHHAIAYLDQEWDSYYQLNSDLLDDDYVMVRDKIIPAWLEAAKAWANTADSGLPPPLPVFPGKRSEQYVEKK